MRLSGRRAYCGENAELTTEHASARWMPGKVPDSDSIAPVRGRHMFAGELTVDDVCARCNNDPGYPTAIVAVGLAAYGVTIMK